jgi:hypothetical protein
MKCHSCCMFVDEWTADSHDEANSSFLQLHLSRRVKINIPDVQKFYTLVSVIIT